MRDGIYMLKFGFFLPRLFGAMLLTTALVCFYFATLYKDLSATTERIDKAFKITYVGNRLTVPTSNDIEKITHLAEQLPEDSNAQIAKVKATMLSWRQGPASENELKLVSQMITQAEQKQPTHYQPFVVRTVMIHHYDFSKQNLIAELDKGLAIAPYEWEYQSLIAPVLVERWHLLPLRIQEKAAPIIRGTLRQKPTRERLIAIMERERNVSPFIKLSPGKWITKRLRRIETELAENEV